MTGDIDLLDQLYRDLGPRITRMLIEGVYEKGGSVYEVMLIAQGIIASLFLTYLKDENFEDGMRMFIVGVANMLEDGERIPMEGFLNTVQKSKMN